MTEGNTMIEFKCPQCGAAMSAPSSLAGASETCPCCRYVVPVPQLDAPVGRIERLTTAVNMGTRSTRARGKPAIAKRRPHVARFWVLLAVVTILVGAGIWRRQSVSDSADARARELERLRKRHNERLAKLARRPPAPERKGYDGICPLKLLEARLGYNVIDQPLAWVKVFNVCGGTVVTFEVGIDCFDRFDRPVSHYAWRSNRFIGIAQSTIRRGEYDDVGWTLHGHDLTARVVIRILRVKLADGREWTPKAGDVITVTGHSRK